MYISREKKHTEKLANFKGGEGYFNIAHITSKEYLNNHGTLFVDGKLEPGNSVGNHKHEGTMEICYFLSGTGIVNDNGVIHHIKEGDVQICLPNEQHEIINDGQETLRYIALVLCE